MLINAYPGKMILCHWVKKGDVYFSLHHSSKEFSAFLSGDDLYAIAVPSHKSAPSQRECIVLGEIKKQLTKLPSPNHTTKKGVSVHKAEFFTHKQ